MNNKILLIDDDETYALTLKVFLKYKGYTARIAGTIQEAVLEIDKKEYMLICCDLDLPDGSGIEILRKVREMDGELPFILVSCYELADFEQNAMQYGATCCIDKMKTQLLKEMIVKYATMQIEKKTLKKNY